MGLIYGTGTSLVWETVEFRCDPRHQMMTGLKRVPGFFFFFTRINTSYHYPSEKQKAGQLTPDINWDLILSRDL